MLSIKKVKVHGIKDSRWTTQDKIRQYKGIINLYRRDNKIVKVDNQIQWKKYDREIKSLKKEIIENRYKLDNAIYGDKQIIRNILAEYEEFRLAFRDVEPLKIIEYVHQNTFNKRKLMDLINHDIKRKTQRLIDLKLRASVLEDRLKYNIDEKLPVELEAACITGKVQDAILKREAALVVQHSYKAILDVMLKDHNYMFKVLEALQEDSFDQARCMYSTMTLGQLATEYLDDRKGEFQDLELQIKKDMKVRQADLEKIRAVVSDMDHKIKRMIRRDSDITLSINHKAFINNLSEGSILNLETLRDLESTLGFLMEETKVSSFSRIFPCIQEQHHQKERLNKFMKELQEQRDGLFTKLKHAHQMYKCLTFSKGASRYQYESEKNRLLELIENEKERKRKMEEHVAYKSDVNLKVRVALQRIEEMVVLVTNPKLKATTQGLEYDDQYVHEAAKEILVVLEQKLIILMQFGEMALLPAQEYVSYTQWQHVMSKVTCNVRTVSQQKDESLIEGIVFEDPSVPSRQDIKKVSAQIVKANTKVDESLLPIPPKKKKFKFKS